MNVEKLTAHFLECCSDLELIALEQAIKNVQTARKEERLQFIQDNPLNEQELAFIAGGILPKAVISYNNRIKCGINRAHQLIVDLISKNEER
jgi:hypothetical protein